MNEKLLKTLHQIYEWAASIRYKTYSDDIDDDAMIIQEEIENYLESENHQEYKFWDKKPNKKGYDSRFLKLYSVEGYVKWDHNVSKWTDYIPAIDENEAIKRFKEKHIHFDKLNNIKSETIDDTIIAHELTYAEGYSIKLEKKN